MSDILKMSYSDMNQLSEAFEKAASDLSEISINAFRMMIDIQNVMENDWNRQIENNMQTTADILSPLDAIASSIGDSWQGDRYEDFVGNLYPEIQQVLFSMQDELKYLQYSVSSVSKKLNDVLNPFVKQMDDQKAECERIASWIISYMNEHQEIETINGVQGDKATGIGAIGDGIEDGFDIHNINHHKNGAWKDIASDVWGSENNLHNSYLEYAAKQGLFGAAGLTAYALKNETDSSTEYFGKTSLSSNDKLIASYKPKEFNNNINDFLKDHDLIDKTKNSVYYDEDGNEIDSKEEPAFYKKRATIAEFQKSAQISTAAYEGSVDIGDNGSLKVKVGEAEAHSSITGGLYVLDKASGEKKFSPGVKAEIGTSFTALETNWDQQWLGDENLGLNTSVDLVVGKASADANATVQVFDADGNADVQINASAEMELIAAEANGKVGVNVLGGEVGVKGSVNVGIGAHADVGYKDGVFKCDIGASVGVGGSVGLEVNVGEMVDTVVDSWDDITDTASAAWENAVDGWNDFWNW